MILNLKFQSTFFIKTHRSQMKQAGKKYKKSWVKHFLHFYRSKRSEIISVTAILHIVSHRQSHEGDDGLIWLRSDVGERKRIAGRLADEKNSQQIPNAGSLWDTSISCWKLQVKDVLVSSAGILLYSFYILLDRITVPQLPLYWENVYNF